MAEKISGLLILGIIAALLCVFIPAAAYMIVRMIGRRLHGYDMLDLAVFLVTVTTFAAVLYIAIDTEQLHPRCSTYGGDSQTMQCLADRYNDLGSAVVLPRDQAVALMRFDLFSDVAWCVIVPFALGIAALLVLAQVLTCSQKRRLS